MYLSFKMVGWITLVSSAVVSLSVAQSPTIAGKPAGAGYPVVAEATANDVDIRSGRGPGYYHCGKVNRGDRVTVIEVIGGWAKILPLAEHYSWIHKNYVRIDPQTPKIGTVTGDNVRVWAGSDFIEPIRSSSMQTRLNTGEIVELFDEREPTGDYYKIKPPSGAYLWISGESLRYVGPVKPAEAEVKPAPVPEPAKEPDTLTLEERLQVEPPKPLEPVIVDPAETTSEAVKPEPPKPTPSKETVYLQRCYDLSDKINAELKNPVDKQDYTPYREALTEIIEDEEAGKSAAFARILLDRIDRYEMAIGVTDTLRQQDQRLQRIRREINKAHQARLEQVPEPEAVPLYTGTLKPSYVYTGTAGQRRYLLTDDSGRILCYLIPAGPEMQGRLEQLLGSKITARGQVVSDPKALVTLVSVTAVQTD